MRLVIAYRELNKITLKDGYPAPRIQDLVDRLGRAQRFSKLDPTSGYYQVQVAQGISGRPHPEQGMGLSVSGGAVWLGRSALYVQRLVRSVFMNELDQFVIVY